MWVFNASLNDATVWGDEVPTFSLAAISTIPSAINNQIKSGIELVRWAFTIGSAFSLLSALLLSIGILPSFSVKFGEEAIVQNGDKCPPGFTAVKTRSFYVLFLSASTLLTILKMFTSSILTQYLQTFAIVGLQWSPDQSSYLNGILGAGQLVGCLATILMSKVSSKYNVPVIGVSLGVWIVGVILMLLTATGVVLSVGMMIGAFLAGKNYFF